MIIYIPQLKVYSTKHAAKSTEIERYNPRDMITLYDKYM